MTTLFSMTVDTEEEWDWDAGWPTTGLATSNIQQLPRFHKLCTDHRVATTYFTNWAVLQDKEALHVIQNLAQQDGTEIGMHIHPWNTPPLTGPVTSRDTFLHNLPESLISAKLDTLYRLFVQLGLTPTSFRGGRYSSGGPIHRFLRDRGFLVDASVVPFTTWKDDGAPDYRHRGLHPVRCPPRHAGDQPFWEIPLTLGFTRRPFSLWARGYNWIEHSWLRRLRLIGVAEKIRLVRKAWLNFEDPKGERMLPFLKLLRRMKLPCICFTVHSSSLVAGLGPYTRTKADETRLFARVEEVFATLAEWPEFQPATVTAIARNLEENGHASTWN
jgi:hypothetical protein